MHKFLRTYSNAFACVCGQLCLLESWCFGGKWPLAGAVVCTPVMELWRRRRYHFWELTHKLNFKVLAYLFAACDCVAIVAANANTTYIYVCANLHLLLLLSQTFSSFFFC